MKTFALPFQRTDHNALHEILLGERIQQNNGDAGEDDDGVFQHVLHQGHFLAFGDIVADAGALHHRLGVGHKVAEHHLQVPQLLIVHVEIAVGEGVPVPYRVEQGQYRNDGGRQRENDPEEHLEIGRAVDLGGLVQLIGDGVDKERAGDHHVVDSHRAGQDHDPGRVQEIQVFDDQIGGDHAAAEQHRKGEIPEDDFFAHHLFAGQRIRAHDGHHDIDGGAGHRIEDGIGKASQNEPVLKELDVGFQGEAVRPQIDLSRAHRVRRADGTAYHIDERYENDDEHQEQESPVEHIEGSVGVRVTDLLSGRNRCGRFIHPGTPLPQTRLGHAPRDRIDDEHHQERYHRLEQADGGGKTVLHLSEADTVHIGGNHVRAALVEVVGEQEDLLESDRQNMRGVQDQQDDRRGQYPGDIHVPDALPDIRAVHGRRLVQLRTDAGQRRDIDDGVVADPLPHARPYVQMREEVGLTHELNGRRSQIPQHIVDHSVQRQDLGQYAADDDRGKEMRDVSDRLYRFLQDPVGHLVDQDGQDDRREESGEHRVKAQADRVAQKTRQLRRAEEVAEPFIPGIRPGARGDAELHIELLEGDQDTVHRTVLERERIDDRKHQKDVELPVIAQIHPDLLELSFFYRLYGGCLSVHLVSFPLFGLDRSALRIPVFRWKNMECGEHFPLHGLCAVCFRWLKHTVPVSK